MNAQKYNPDVLTCLANLSNDEVFTPPDVANRMLDTLPNELWSNPEAKFLDPFCKTGVFLREIAKRLLKGLESQIPDLQERIDHIMHHQLYGIGITELTAYLSRRSLYCSTRADGKHSVTEFPDESGNIFFEEISHTWDKAGKCTYCGVSSENFGEEKREGLSQHAYAFIHDKNPYENMNFDVIIGNPPYQLNVGVEKKNFAIAIYHKFIQQAIKLNPQYLCMIVPSRWFAGGRGLDDFRDEMLNDKRLKEIHDYPDASGIFPGVSVEGGINYFLWQNNYRGDCLVKTYKNGDCVSAMTRPLKEEGTNIFIRDNQAISIYHKVKKLNEKSFSEIVSVQTPFGLVTSFKAYKKEPFDNAVKIYINGGIGYITPETILKNHDWINNHKVYIGEAYGMGKETPYKVLGTPFYGEPKSCCTQTYLVIGPFVNKERCEYVISYIKTRFFRFMVLLTKNTQHAMRGVYKFVPQQKFDKPWTDEELYEKYGLTEEEIAYIEKMVRPME